MYWAEHGRRGKRPLDQQPTVQTQLLSDLRLLRLRMLAQHIRNEQWTGELCAWGRRVGNSRDQQARPGRSGT